VNIAEYLVYN